MDPSNHFHAVPAARLFSAAPRILIVIVDPGEVVPAAQALSDEGFSVHYARDGEEAVRTARETHPNLVLIALGAPTRIGLDVLRALRALGDVPIVVVCETATETDRVVALELGADDCLTQPIGTRELVARVGAVLRRTRCECGETRGFETAGLRPDLEIDVPSSQVRRRGRVVPLTPTEFRILEALVRHSGQTMTRAQLLEHVAAEGDVFDRTLDRHIANLRKKMEDDPSRPRYVITVFGIGYKFAG